MSTDPLRVNKQPQVQLDGAIDPRIRTNGEAPEQLVKVTDRRHRHPVFATVCSLAFLLTIIGIIVICTN